MLLHFMVIFFTNKMMENQLAFFKIVVVEYFSYGYKEGSVILNVVPRRQELAKPAFDIS